MPQSATDIVVNVVTFPVAGLTLRSILQIMDGPTGLSERTGDEWIWAFLTGGLR